MGGTPAFLNTVDYSGLIVGDINTIQKITGEEKNSEKNGKGGTENTRKVFGKGSGDFIKITFSRNRSDKEPIKGRNIRKDLQRIQQIIAKLQMIDQKVRAHEMAHLAVGGPYAGGVSYSYVQGPDGRLYAVAGEVPIDLSDAPTPEETVVKMRTVIAAALAPADPSPQDLKVAAIASQKLMKALMELAKKHQEELLKGNKSATGQSEGLKVRTEGNENNTTGRAIENNTKNQEPVISYQISCNECRNRMGNCQNPFACSNRVFKPIEDIFKSVAYFQR